MDAAPLDTERVWADLHAGLRRFVARRVRTEADADDIVQRVFLKVHQSLPQLRDADRLHGWLYRLTRRAIVDYYRSPARQREVPMGDADPDALDAGRVASRPVGNAPADTGDVDQAAFRELASCLHPLVAQLSELDQEALRLVEVEELSQVDAARQLGLSVSGMKSRVQRARARLRQVVEDCCRVELDRRGGLIGYTKRDESCGGCG